MPAYEFENKEHGITVLVPMPVAQLKDEITLSRVRVPSRINIGVGAQPPTTSDKLRQGYKKLEEKGQLQDRPGYMPARTLKRVLETPD